MSPMVADLEKSVKLGAIFGAIFFALGLVATYLKFNVANLFSSVPLSSGVTAGLGKSVFNFFQGYLPFSLGALAFMIIAGIAVVFVGLTVYPFLFKMNNEKGKTWLVLMYGTLIIGLIMLGLAKILVLGTILGLGIYYLIATLVAVELLKVKL